MKSSLKPRAELALATVACAAGAGLAVYAASRTWVVEEALQVYPFPPLGIKRSGGDIVPALPAFALVALAGAGAILATRSIARVVIGGLLVATGAAVAIAAGSYLDYRDVRPLWVILSLVGGLLVVAAGAFTAWRGRGWPAMGGRYERPAPDRGNPDDPARMWDAIERGTDPTKGER